MQAIKWLGFGQANAVSQSVVHFFPAGRGVSAPYPATCSIAVFGQFDSQSLNIQKKKVVLDGARLSQPDGVLLSQAFPLLQEGLAGFFGLTVEIHSVQPRIDLSASSCVVEFSSQAALVKYWPQVIVGKEVNPAANVLVINDEYLQSSLLIINGGAETCSPDLWLNLGHGQALDLSGKYQILADCLLELNLGELLQAQNATNLTRTSLFFGERPPDVAAYIIYRDYNTRKPVSVSAI